MPYFDRFDICEAYHCLEMDYNVSGVLWERLDHYRGNRRPESVDYQLHRMHFRGRPNLEYATLEENGREIYDNFVAKYNLPTGDSEGVAEEE